ncbi:hypothetical protein E2K93_03730 [Thalassotalea sp. HSM 43]|uniref:hypothetical protein n=1 Tax=Thalassotalea sp. HSM 43 TaxID=2552945 RepID=UPI001081FD0F|nr:hypothetical protein [Thalassotalea sp. HSM 43]QBY03542.1 hypothetical protein E2K93_03730 [Thalassotalea sp. HSM 43]
MKLKDVLLDKLEILKEVSPIKGIVQVGIRESIVERYNDWGVESCLLVDTDPKLSKKIERAYKHLGWNTVNVTVASTANERSFFLANNPKESGLVDIKALSKYWRNLKVAHIKSVQTETLENLLDSIEVTANWLCIDCFPAMEIIEGLGSKLNRFDVITARVIIDDAKDAPLGATKKECIESLTPHGFVCIAIEDETNPNIATLVFNRKFNEKAEDMEESLISNDVYQTLDAKLKSSEERVTELSNIESKLETQVASLESLNEKLRNECLSIEKKLMAAESNLIAENDSSNNLTKEKEQLITALNIAKAEIEPLKAQLSETHKVIDASAIEVNSLTTSNDELQKVVARLTSEKGELQSTLNQSISEQDKHQAMIVSLESSVAELNDDKKGLTEQINALAEENNGLSSQKESLESTIKQLTETNELLNKQNQTLTNLVDGQSKLFQSLENNLSHKITTGLNNSVKQIESYIGVQNYLENGTVGLDYHGWPISSDIALFLLNKVETNNYDLVIEFGSGTSTMLFAQAMKNLTNRSENDFKRISVDAENSQYLASHQDLPKKVVTFEHNKKYFDKTSKSLVNSNFDDVVELVHAPLVDYKVGEKNYLYYSCESMLQQIKQIFNGRTAKILILIDGPPATTGPLARFPAIPMILNNLANHQLDIVLDDYNRQEEKEIVDGWKKIFEERFITYEEEVVNCEKGAFFCRLNS